MFKRHKSFIPIPLEAAWWRFLKFVIIKRNVKSSVLSASLSASSPISLILINESCHNGEALNIFKANN